MAPLAAAGSAKPNFASHSAVFLPNVGWIAEMLEGLLPGTLPYGALLMATGEPDHGQVPPQG